MNTTGHLLISATQCIAVVDELMGELAEIARCYSLTTAYERLDRWKRRTRNELRRISPEEAQVFELKSRAFAITDSEEIFQNEVELLSEFLRGFRAEIESSEGEPMLSDNESRDVAQICLSGHVANTRFQDHPEFNKAFCEQCGSKTIAECQQCHQGIPGDFPGSLALSDNPPPKFCIHCGSPYPWTSLALQVALDTADEAEKLSAEQREQLKSSIRDLVQDSPKTGLAVVRFKKLMTAAGSGIADIIKKALAEVLSEAIKRQISV